MRKFLAIGFVAMLLGATTANAQSVHSISYSAKRVSPGTIVSLGGRDFVLVRLPMADFGSTDRYIVEFLADVVTPGAPPTFFANLQTEHSNETLLNPILIDGFPANVQVGDSREYQFGTSFTLPGTSLTVDALVIGIARVKVGGTMITFFGSFATEQQAETAALPNAQYSGSPVAAWNNYVDPISQVATLDNWVDYIRILKIN
jgi:hypothetical protein